MNTRRLVLASIACFVLAWGTLLGVASRSGAPGQHSSSPAQPGEHGFSHAEVARHDRPEDCWIIVRGRVYDVTRYLPEHPAPRRTITDACGTESTHAFETKGRSRAHTPHAWELLESYFIGELRN